MEHESAHHIFITFLIMIVAGAAALAGFPAGAADSSAGGGAGFYQVDSDPQGADVYLDSQFAGDTPVTITVYPTSPPGHTITISLPGYQKWSRTYKTDPAPGELVTVYAVLQPTGSPGTLIVYSSPNEAMVTLDGGHGQMTPWTYANLVPGDHLVQLFLSGYQPYTTIVTVPSGGSIPITAVLLPLTNVGVLQVKSNPGGADLYVDQVFAGITETTVGNLQEGQHEVVLRLAGYEDWKGTVPVKGGATTTITPVLVPTGRAPSGDIQVSSSPPGAAVYLDGIYRGVTPPAEHLELTGIAPGNHTLSIQQRNYHDFLDTITVTAGQIYRISPTLVPASNPSPFANLQITSQPSGAEVRINSAYQGKTPLSLSSYPAGNYTLQIQMKGYQEFTQPLNVLPAQDQLISTTLIPDAPATRSGTVPVLIVLMFVLIILLMKRGRGR